MEKGIMAGVAVGGTIALEALVGGPVTGASMNPARSLAPAVLRTKSKKIRPKPYRAIVEQTLHRAARAYI